MRCLRSRYTALAHQLGLYGRLAFGESELFSRFVDVHVDRVAFGEVTGEDFGGDGVFEALLDEPL